MSRYMILASYTNDAKAAFARGPQDRTSSVVAMVEKFGGKVISIDFALGEYDIVVIAEGIDDTTAAAISLVATSPGHLKNYKTTRLLSQEEMNQASKLASSFIFEGPASKK